MQRRILIADNDSTGLALKKLIGADPELQVDEIADGAAALQALSEQNYSIFLVDLMMPSLGGIGLMEEIQKRNLPVPVIVMTGPSSIDRAVQVMRLGAYDILTKPVMLTRYTKMVMTQIIKQQMLRYCSAVEQQPVDRFVLSWDIALSEKEAADYSTCVVLLTFPQRSTKVRSPTRSAIGHAV